MAAQVRTGDEDIVMSFERKTWDAEKSMLFWKELNGAGKPGIMRDGESWYVVRNIDYPDTLRKLTRAAREKLFAMPFMSQVAEDVYTVDSDAMNTYLVKEKAEATRAEEKRHAQMIAEMDAKQQQNRAHRTNTAAAALLVGSVGVGGAALAISAAEATRRKKQEEADRLRRRQDEEEEEDRRRRARSSAIYASCSDTPVRHSCGDCSDTPSYHHSCSDTPSCSDSPCDSSSCDYSGGGSSSDW